MLRKLIDLIRNSFTLIKAKSRPYPAETITNADHENDLARLVDTEAESIRHSLEQVVGCIGFYVNANKTCVARWWAFVSVGVGVGERQSEDPFVCFGAKHTQRACARYFLQDRKKTRKGKVPGQSKNIRVSDGQKKQLLKEELGSVNPEAESANARR